MKISPRSSGEIAGLSAGVLVTEDLVGSRIGLPVCAKAVPVARTPAIAHTSGRKVMCAPLALFKHIQEAAEEARVLLFLRGCFRRLFTRRRGLAAPPRPAEARQMVGSGLLGGRRRVFGRGVPTARGSRDDAAAVQGA